MPKPTNQIPQKINQFLHAIQSDVPIYIGFSGGLDSTVLLHALHAEISQSEFNNPLVAIYVDHGLQDQSTSWSMHCQKFAEQLGVEYKTLKVEIAETQRKGIEAVARTERYKAFANEIAKGTVPATLVTAHHQKDQAETLLLNLLRGAGVHGLAAMPVSKPLQTRLTDAEQSLIEHYRPLLEVSYQSMVDYASDKELSYIEDPSNRDVTFKRNLVRHRLLPLLNESWNDVERKLSETASYLQESVVLLEEYAELELANAEKGYDFFQMPPVSVAQQKNILRYWFKQNWSNTTLTSQHYEWVLGALEGYQSSSNQSFAMQLPVGELRVYKDRVYYLKNTVCEFDRHFSSSAVLHDFITQAGGDAEGGGNGFLFKINRQDESLQVVLRSIRTTDEISRKKLKTFFQENNIPFWLRETWPVLEIEKTHQLIVLGCPRCTNYSLSFNDCLELKLSYRVLRFLQSQNS